MLKMRQIGFLVFAIGLLSTPAWGAVPGRSVMGPVNIDNNNNTITWDMNRNATENPPAAQGTMETDRTPVLLAHGGGGGGGAGAGAGGGDCGADGGDSGAGAGGAGGGPGAGTSGCSGNGADGAGGPGNGNSGGNGATPGPNGTGVGHNQM